MRRGHFEKDRRLRNRRYPGIGEVGEKLSSSL